MPGMGINSLPPYLQDLLIQEIESDRALKGKNVERQPVVGERDDSPRRSPRLRPMLDPDPNYEHGQVLPIARHKQTGAIGLGMPGFLREGAQDLLGLFDEFVAGQEGEGIDPAAVTRGALALTGSPAAAGVRGEGGLAMNLTLPQRRQRAQEWLAAGPRKDLEPLPKEGLFLDRRLLDQPMDTPPYSIPRVKPSPRQNVSWVDKVFEDDLARQVVTEGTKRGMEMGGRTYYNLGPLKQRFREMGLPDEEFERFAWLNAATSPRTPVLPNQATASAVNYALKRGGTVDDVKTIYQRDFPRGPGLQYIDKGKGGIRGNHAALAEEAIRKGHLPGFDRLQKVSSYGEGLRGNRANVPLDTHEIAGTSFTTPFYEELTERGTVPKEAYGAWERRFVEDIAKPLGLEPADAQAGRWFGMGELTGLRTQPSDFVDLWERNVLWNAKTRDLPTDPKSLRDFSDRVLRGEDVLYPYMGKKPLPRR